MAISKEVLIQAVRSYQSKYSTFRFREVKDLKPKQIETALTRICPHVKQAEVVAFWDETMFGSGKKGFLLTCDTLYFSKEYYIDGNKSKHNVTISDFDTVKKMVGRPNCVGIVHKNGETEWVYVSINQDDMFEFFCKVIQFRNEEKHARKEEESFRDPEPEPAKPAPKPEPVKPAPESTPKPFNVAEALEKQRGQIMKDLAGLNKH